MDAPVRWLRPMVPRRLRRRTPPRPSPRLSLAPAFLLARVARHAGGILLVAAVAAVAAVATVAALAAVSAVIAFGRLALPRVLGRPGAAAAAGGRVGLGPQPAVLRLQGAVGRPRLHDRVRSLPRVVSRSMRRHRRPYGRGRHRSGLSALRMPPLRPTPLRRRFPAVFARGPRRGRHGGASCRRGSDADRCWVCTARHARRGLPPPGSEPLVAPRAAPLRRPAQPPPRGACRGAAARRVPRARLASHAPLRFHPKRLAKDAALALMRRLPLRYRPVWRAQVGVRRCRLQALPRLRAARHRPAAGGVAQPLHRLASASKGRPSLGASSTPRSLAAPTASLAAPSLS